MWIIVSALPGEFPTDPEDCNTDDQSERCKEQVAKFHECLILVHFWPIVRNNQARNRHVFSVSVADNVISLAREGGIAGSAQASLCEPLRLFKPVIARLPLITERYGTPGGSVMISPDKAKLAIVGKLEISPNSGSNERFSRLSGRPITA
jgi:hypothetical protein